MAAWQEKNKARNLSYLFLLLIVAISVFPMVGCISASPGIYQLFIAELNDSHVQFGYIGICSTIPNNGRVCKPTLASAPEELAKDLKLPIKIVQQVLALQHSVSLALPAISAILIFLGFITSLFALSNNEKPVKSSRRRWIASTRVFLWGAVGFAFAAAYLLTFSIGAIEAIVPSSSTGSTVTRGILMQFLQWVVFSVTVMYVITVHYRLHLVVKQVWEGDILPVSDKSKTPTPPTTATPPATEKKEGPAPAQESTRAQNDPLLNHPLLNFLGTLFTPRPTQTTHDSNAQNV
ncbi:hypothetical protein V492_02112 [Pseudogymnoascus sp. VKM F-4246]|nr:hypothetical protein V492_02112 [Pseudogymnoascus sp. VKM F-4246]